MYRLNNYISKWNMQNTQDKKKKRMETHNGHQALIINLLISSVAYHLTELRQN